MRRWCGWGLLTLAAAAVLTASCRPAAQGVSAAASQTQSPAADKVYPAVGVVEGFDSGGQVIVLRNRPIAGFMDAMTMSYELQPPSLAQGLKVGDAVDFTITVRGDDDLVTALKKR